MTAATIDPFQMTTESPTSFGLLMSAGAKLVPAWYHEDRKFWVVLRHHDVVAAMRNPEVFSAQFYANGPTGNVFLSKDGPEHQKGRRMFSRAFAPLAIRQAEERFVRPAAERIVAQMAGRSEVELVDDFCLTLPMQVMGDLMGVGLPFVQAQLLRVPALVRWTVWQGSDAEVGVGRAAMAAMMDDLRPVVRRELASPGENLIGALVRSAQEEGTASEESLLVLSVGLLLGGYETTAGMLAAALSAFLLNPAALRRVRADRSLLAPAIEEAMRWANPGIGVPRRVLRDVDLGEGVVIPAGSDALLCSVGAHYDDALYPNPEVFDIDRRSEPLLFGLGTHYCLGAPLARMETKVGLSLLLDRLPNLRLDPARPPRFTCGVRGTVTHGPLALHALHDALVHATPANDNARPAFAA